MTIRQTSDGPPVRLVDLAAELGFNSSSMRKAVRRRGFEPFQLAEGQSKPYFLSAHDAEALRKRVEDERSLVPISAPELISKGLSGVYAIEVPSYDGPTRIKIGWSDDITERLNTYRTIVPDLRVSRVWPCSQSFLEQTALLWADRNGRRVGQELFEFDDPASALEVLSELFSSLGIKPSDRDTSD